MTTTTISFPEPQVFDPETGERDRDAEVDPRLVITHRFEVYDGDRRVPAECILSIDIKGIAEWLGHQAWHNKNHATQVLNNNAVASVRLVK